MALICQTFKCTAATRAALGSLQRGFAGEAIAVGVNIKKGGTDQPLLPVSEYPPWVMELATPQETMFDLRKKLASKGQDNLEELEAARIVKLESRHGIRSLNTSKAKK